MCESRSSNHKHSALWGKREGQNEGGQGAQLTGKTSDEKGVDLCLMSESEARGGEGLEVTERAARGGESGCERTTIPFPGVTERT